jgi:hypothetical protein
MGRRRAKSSHSWTPAEVRRKRGQEEKEEEKGSGSIMIGHRLHHSPNSHLGPTARCRAVAALRRGNGRRASLNVIAAEQSSAPLAG